MTETMNYPPGTFCWVDLATSYTAPSKAFDAAAVAATQGAGGGLLAPVMEIAEVGRFAFLQGLQGAVFAVIAFVAIPA
jgi:predicted enzyme related to lactoylglutathione lyase